MFHRIIFLLWIVSSLSCSFNRCAVCFQSFSEHRLQEYLKCYYDQILDYRFFFARLAVQYLKYMVCKLQLHTIKESGIFLRSKPINFRPPLQCYASMAWLPRTQDNLITSTIWCGTHNRAGLQFKCVLTDNPPSPGEVGHTTGVYVPYSFRTVVWVLLRPTIVL